MKFILVCLLIGFASALPEQQQEKKQDKRGVLGVGYGYAPHVSAGYVAPEIGVAHAPLAAPLGVGISHASYGVAHAPIGNGVAHAPLAAPLGVSISHASYGVAHAPLGIARPYGYGGYGYGAHGAYGGIGPYGLGLAHGPYGFASPLSHSYLGGSTIIH